MCQYYRIVILLFVVLSGKAYGQDYELLWEIKGKDVDTPSYIFGSLHHNAEEIFVLHDSLEYAIKSCKAFANEVNFDSLSTYLSNDFFSEFFEGDQSTQTTQDESDHEFFEFVDKNGKETLLDLYLYKIARALGHEIYGLESMDKDIFYDEMLNRLNPNTEDFDYQSVEFRNFLSVYATGDLSAIEGLMDQYDVDEDFDLNMIERNRIQANSIIELSQRAPTFSVVGAAHLFGEENVLDILRDQGYHVRKVGLGNPTKALDELYHTMIDNPNIKIKGTLPGYRILSETDTEPIRVYDAFDLHTNMSLDGGYFIMSMIIPSSVTERIDLQDELIKNMVGKASGLTLQKADTTGTLKFFYYETEQDILVLTSEESQYLTSLQIAFCFSKKVLESSEFQRDLNLISFVDETVSWHVQSKNGICTYLFPDDIDWQVNELVRPDFPERGEMQITFKTFTDPVTKDEYLVRYDANPPGITYPDPYDGLWSTLNSFLELFNTQLVSSEYFKTNKGYAGIEAEAIDTSSNHEYYFKMMIRGSALYVALQKSPYGHRNDRFFTSFELKDLEFNDELKPFHHKESFLHMKVPDRMYHTESHPDSLILDEFSFAYGSNTTVFDLELQQYNRYDQLASLDSLHSDYIESIIVQADSVIEIKSWHQDETCPIVGVQYIQDSSALLRTEAVSYCNDFSYTFLILSPIEFGENQFVDSIINTVKIEKNPELGFDLSDNKLPLLLEDLRSRDTTVFNPARAALDDMDEVDEEYDELLITALTHSFVDDELDYNSSYDILTLLHDIQNDDVEEALVSHFNTTENAINKTRILESLSLRVGPHSFDRLIKLLEQKDSNLLLDDDIYSAAKDSTSTYIAYYKRLEALATEDIAYTQFLELNVYYLDSIIVNQNYSTKWFEDQMESQTLDYIENIKTDTTISADPYMMDYYLSPQSSNKLVNQLYNNIALSKDYYAKYRMIYNQKIRGEKVSLEQVKEAASIPHYRYWLLSLYSGENEIPNALKNIALNATSVQKRYLQTEYDAWTDECDIYNTYDSKSGNDLTMALVGCKNSEEENYYFGLVGPFTSDEFIDLDDQESVYYSKPISPANFKEIEEKLVEYYYDN